MKHQALFFVISCITLSIVFCGCDVEESFLIVENHSNVTIVSIFISHTEDSSWGSDQLPLNVLRPRSMITIAVESGTYNVKLVSEYGREFVYEATIVSGMTTTVALR